MKKKISNILSNIRLLIQDLERNWKINIKGDKKRSFKYHSEINWKPYFYKERFQKK